jgi:glycosyltransferase involved in cell wall biosynthesis
MVREMGLTNEVNFTGKIKRKEAFSILRTCDVLIFPSESEGFCNAVAESLALGCPVISYNYKTAVDDGLNNAVVLIDSFEPQEYANAAERLLLDCELRENISKRGIELIKPFVNLSLYTRLNRMTQILVGQ